MWPPRERAASSPHTAAMSSPGRTASSRWMPDVPAFVSLLGGETRDRARQQVEIALARQPIDPPVDPLQGIAALVAVEEIVHEEPHLAPGHHAGAHGSPPVRQGEARHSLRLDAVAQAACRLRRVEVDVPALLLHD